VACNEYGMRFGSGLELTVTLCDRGTAMKSSSAKSSQETWRSSGWGKVKRRPMTPGDVARVSQGELQLAAAVVL
jgi:hypothetical protein